MKNFKTILLISILILVNCIRSQDYNRFTSTKIIQYPLGNLYFSQAYLDVANNMLYAVNNNAIYKILYTDVLAANSSTQVDDQLTISFDASTNIGGMVVMDDIFYGLSNTNMYKINTITPADMSDTFNYGDTYDAIGSVGYNNYVYFYATSASDGVIKLTPGLPNADLSSSSYTFTETQTLSALTMVQDLTLGIAFVGDSEGNILPVDLNDVENSAYTMYTNPDYSGDTFQRYAAAIDTTNQMLYFCTSSGGVSLVVEVLSYADISTSNVLEPVSVYQLPINARSCSDGFIDPVQGQIFFTVYASSGQFALIGTDAKGDNSGITYIDDVLVDSIYSIINTSTSTITVFTASQIIVTNYKSICSNDCSGHGSCVAGVCQCVEPYTTADCSQKKCEDDCTDTDHGTCNNGVCICTSNYTGSACADRRCPDSCYGHGTCSGAPDYTCSCDSGYNGTNCNNQIVYPPPPCSYYNNSQDCVDRVACGWCELDKLCKEGDRYGPSEGFCRTWYYDVNVETGVIALASIFIALISILFLVDIISTGPIDKDRAKAYAEEFKSGTYPKLSHEDASVLWWRDQRSAKAWTLMDQFQFVSLISHLGVVFPSRFLHFTEFLDWTNLGIPFPPAINPPTVGSRDEISMFQYNNSLGTLPLYQLANILFWFGLLCGVFLVPLLIAFAILSIADRTIHWKEVIRNRIIHVSIRILTFGYIGVLCSACFSMVTPIHNYQIIIPGAILFVLYGIGFPLALFFILKVPEARLHHPTFKQQFGCLYVNFKPKSDHRFFIFGFIKRFIMAVIIGILAFKATPSYPLTGTDLAVPIVQVAVIVLVIAAYLVILVIRKPYFDHFHQWLEYFLGGINIVTVALSLTHIKSPSVAGELIAWILQALALVACIAAYMISWVQMKSTFLEKLKSFFKICSCCKSRDKKSIDMNEFKN